jgi:SAM-dependent methyltransferase
MGGEELYNQQREYFLSFLARTTQKDKTIEHLLGNLPVYSPQTTTAIEEGKQTRFLDIGSGIGRVLIPLVVRLGDRINCTIQEPNLGMAVNFFLNYLVEDLHYRRLTINHKETFDYAQEQFDFVLSSHSFYYLPDWEDTLRVLYDSLVPGGAACIVMGSEQSELIKLRREFFPILHGESPKTAEDLEVVLEKAGIPYKVKPIHSRIDLAPDIGEDGRHLKESGTLNPSLESLFSFFLRTDYTKLPPEMQERVKRVIDEISDGRYLNLTDRAVWITKPGVYEQRSDAGENPTQEVTLEYFIKLFEPSLESHFGGDVSFLSPGLKQAYFSILALDCVLTHPISRLVIYSDNNSFVTQDEESRPVPIHSNRIKDFVLVDPRVKMKIKDSPCFDDKYYMLLYTLGQDMQEYLIMCLHQEYNFLPEQDKRDVPKREFFRLILNIFDKFKHNQVFSNRFDGSTLIGLYLISPYLAREKLRTPDEVTPKLAEYYRELGIPIAL